MGAARGVLAPLASLMLAAAVVVAPVTAAPAHANEAGTIYALLNDARAGEGLGPLTRNAALDQVALTWANQMATNGEMTHNPSVQSEIPSGWSRVGENVARGFPTGSAMHTGWWNSPGHRANMLGPYTDVGIAFVEAAGSTWGVQVFATYGTPPPPPPPAPEPAPAPPPPAPEPAPAAPPPASEPPPAPAPPPPAEPEPAPPVEDEDAPVEDDSADAERAGDDTSADAASSPADADAMTPRGGTPRHAPEASANVSAESLSGAAVPLPVGAAAGVLAAALVGAGAVAGAFFPRKGAPNSPSRSRFRSRNGNDVL